MNPKIDIIAPKLEEIEVQPLANFIKTHDVEQSPIPYRFPFRIGRKQKRAMLDANGLEIVIFPEGNEEIARITCLMWNQWHKDLVQAWSKIEAG